MRITAKSKQHRPSVGSAAGGFRSYGRQTSRDHTAETRRKHGADAGARRGQPAGHQVVTQRGDQSGQVTRSLAPASARRRASAPRRVVAGVATELFEALDHRRTAIGSSSPHTAAIDTAASTRPDVQRGWLRRRSSIVAGSAGGGEDRRRCVRRGRRCVESLSSGTPGGNVAARTARSTRDRVTRRAVRREERGALPVRPTQLHEIDEDRTVGQHASAMSKRQHAVAVTVSSSAATVSPDVVGDDHGAFDAEGVENPFGAVGLGEQR